MSKLPISLDLIQKHREIPTLIAKLTYVDKKQAIKFMRLWGEKRITISEIHEQLFEAVVIKEKGEKIS